MCQSLTEVSPLPLMAKRRILLLDASTRQALSACRALGRAEYSVGVAGYGGPDVSRYSRYAATYHRLPDPSGAAEAFRDALARLIADHEYEALVASDDATLARLASAPPPIPSSPRLGPAFDRLTDKGGWTRMAEVCKTSSRVRFPSPHFTKRSSLDDLVTVVAPPDPVGRTHMPLACSQLSAFIVEHEKQHRYASRAFHQRGRI